MKERDYGGAFDIDPASYWTRDDLNELWEEIDTLAEDKGYPFRITELYLKEDRFFDLSYRLETDDRVYALEEEIAIDRRKVRTGMELMQVYAPILLEAIASELEKQGFFAETERG